MKIIVDIKGDLRENDILIYDGQQFKPVSKNSFLFKTKQENIRLDTELKKLKNDFVIFKANVNDKLKNYHNILQTLTKEE